MVHSFMAWSLGSLVGFLPVVGFWYGNLELLVLKGRPDAVPASRVTIDSSTLGRSLIRDSEYHVRCYHHWASVAQASRG
jgi:hypothetical protein